MGVEFDEVRAQAEYAQTTADLDLVVLAGHRGGMCRRCLRQLAGIVSVIKPWSNSTRGGARDRPSTRTGRSTKTVWVIQVRRAPDGADHLSAFCRRPISIMTAMPTINAIPAGRSGHRHLHRSATDTFARRGPVLNRPRAQRGDFGLPRIAPEVKATKGLSTGDIEELKAAARRRAADGG